MTSSNVHSDALARYISTTKLHRSTSADKPTKILAPIQDGIKEYWAQAKVAPGANIYVDVGLGVYLEMSVDEAERFVESVIVRIDHRVNELARN
ncbi:hypothetical protein POJ06DRAFT_242686 [Lipomyces tetrasporus]|uniref:Uncharacterized protein n=1 Tax=Lipomyces tetrasporus TaxID=54092 RepID=A0AAD7VWP1_9ASCO|nr:uncharacterized protein POJ06DRAFT_242686 [Lipomyces tetrasporus]KAJ8103735.1 hypothetical protein POJ06DRAFT_242686 [Lipomyces tetrasporus]